MGKERPGEEKGPQISNIYLQTWEKREVDKMRVWEWYKEKVAFQREEKVSGRPH